VITPKIGQYSSYSKCLIYFHPGAGIAGSPKDMIPILNRYAVEADANVISIPYRFGSTDKPYNNGWIDGHAAVLDVLETPMRFNCHPKAIAMMGEGGGGWVASEIAAKMALDGDDRLAVQFLVSPDRMTPNSETVEGVNPAETAYAAVQQLKFQSHGSPTESQMAKATASDDAVEKLPKTLFLTSDLDYNESYV